MNRILVTGATGFIGSPCVQQLAAAGFEVHAAALGVDPRTDGAVTYHDVDLLDSGRIHDLIALVRPTHLLHLAWYVAPGAYWTSLENIRWITAGLDLAREFADGGGKRAVFVGTCAEYEPSTEPLVEGVTPLRPSTLYGASKTALHVAAMAYLAQRGISCAWAHLFYLFGPAEYPSRLVPSVITALLDGETFECGRPDDVLDFLHVDDVAGGLAALVASSVTGDVNVASGRPVSVRDLCGSIAARIGRPELVTYREGSDDRSVVTADASRLSGEVGWSSTVSLDEGLEATIDWWKRHRASDAGSS